MKGWATFIWLLYQGVLHGPVLAGRGLTYYLWFPTALWGLLFLFNLTNTTQTALPKAKRWNVSHYCGNIFGFFLMSIGLICGAGTFRLGTSTALGRSLIIPVYHAIAWSLGILILAWGLLLALAVAFLILCIPFVLFSLLQTWQQKLKAIR